MEHPPVLEKVFQADDSFHDAVNRLGGNKMVVKISNMVRTLTHAMRMDSVDQMLSSGRAAELYEAHERLFQLLQSRDSGGLNRKIRSTYFVDGKPLDNWD